VFLARARCRQHQIHIHKTQHTAAHRGMGTVSALVGDLQRSVAETAWFDRYGPWMRRYFEQPAWEGAPLAGKTIMLWTNAGLGDTILKITEMHTITGGTGRFAGARGTFIVERQASPVAFKTCGSFQGTLTSPGAAH